MISKTRLAALTIAAALLAFTAAACNTVAGAGKDVQAVGHAVTHSADNVKREIEN